MRGGRSSFGVVLASLCVLACNGNVTPPDHNPRRIPDAVPACDPEAPSVGSTPLRRLTRSQYQNAVVDLFGVAADYTAMLPIDERVGNFNSNSAIAVDRVMLERYLDTADAVIEAADVHAMDDCNRFVEEPVECARRFIAQYGRLIYRRAPNLIETQRLVAIYETYGASDHVFGLSMMLRTMLSSPSFVYHDDYLIAGEPDGELQPLGPSALATRMAAFIWDSVPDGQLLDAAQSGALDEPETLRAEAERMIADPRASRSIGAFARDWLGLGELALADRNPELYPTYNAAMGSAMLDETQRFFSYVIRDGDGELETLLTADFSIVPAELQAHYGLPLSSPTDAPVSFDPERRAGFLTHASVMTAHAHTSQSSLTLRGKLIREQIFCQELPEPPNNADITLPEVGARSDHAPAVRSARLGARVRVVSSTHRSDRVFVRALRRDRPLARPGPGNRGRCAGGALRHRRRRRHRWSARVGGIARGEPSGRAVRRAPALSLCARASRDHRGRVQPGEPRRSDESGSKPARGHHRDRRERRVSKSTLGCRGRILR